MPTVVSEGRVRFGGRPGPEGWEFELSGGHPALDLANTVDARPTIAPVELLTDYAALVAFSRQAQLVDEGGSRRLRREAARRPAAAETCLRRARALRETLFAIFSAVAEGLPIPSTDLAALNAVLPGALARRRLAAGRDGASWTFEHPPGALDPMLPSIVIAAADLLTSTALDRVRRCEGRDCAWLFLDESRNRTRRWCDMTVCGNRAKVRRHRERSAGREQPGR